VNHMIKESEKDYINRLKEKVDIEYVDIRLE
jgi:hypothetical protein